MLEEASLQPPLGTPHEFATVDHQLISRRGDKTGVVVGCILAPLPSISPNSLRRKNRIDTQAAVAQRQSLRYPAIGAINRTTFELRGIVGRDRVGEFVTVKNCAATGRTLDDAEAVGVAKFEVYGFFLILIAAQRDRRLDPRVKP